MSGRPVVLIASLAAFSVLGCDSTEVTEGSIDLITGGGFEADENILIGSSVSARDPAWDVVPGFGVHDDHCFVEGSCTGGSLISYADYLAPEPPESQGRDRLQDGKFGFVSTQNFVYTFEDVAVTVLKSGMQLTFTVPDKSRMRLKFEYAFLTNNVDDDAASVLICSEPTCGSVETAILRLTKNDLDEEDLVAGGCGIIDENNLDDGFGGSVGELLDAEYPICTQWQTHFVDFSAYRGQEVVLRVLAEEVGGDNEAPTTLLVDTFRIAELVEG